MPSDCSVIANYRNHPFMAAGDAVLRYSTKTFFFSQFIAVAWSRRMSLYPQSTCSKARTRAVPWLRSLVAGLSPRRPGFASGSIHVGFVVDKLALGQVFLRVLRFSTVNIIPPSLSKLISSGECVIF
jgi:hypothetical protein